LLLIVPISVALPTAFKGVLLFAPASVMSFLAGFAATRQFPEFFDRGNPTQFIVKVLLLVLPIFAALAVGEVFLLPSR